MQYALIFSFLKILILSNRFTSKDDINIFIFAIFNSCLFLLPLPPRITPHFKDGGTRPDFENWLLFRSTFSVSIDGVSVSKTGEKRFIPLKVQFVCFLSFLNPLCFTSKCLLLKSNTITNMWSIILWTYYVVLLISLGLWWKWSVTMHIGTSQQHQNGEFVWTTNARLCWNEF